MKGVIGGDTQASQVSSLVGSSLNFDLEENIKTFFKNVRLCQAHVFVIKWKSQKKFVLSYLTIESTTGGRMAHLRHTPSTIARTPATPLTRGGEKYYVLWYKYNLYLWHMSCHTCPLWLLQTLNSNADTALLRDTAFVDISVLSRDYQQSR